MPGSNVEFTPWNSPHLVVHKFILFGKLIAVLNSNVPSGGSDVEAETPQEVLQVFTHEMMSSWLALAKSYYPFYQTSNQDMILIKALEQKLNIKASDYESLSALIQEVFLSKYPKVNSQYHLHISNMKKVMGKLTAVVLSTPLLIKNAHEHDRKNYEDAAPSMSTCITSMEAILRHMMSRTELDKSFVITASSLLIQVKAIKSRFEQIALMQQIEIVKMENKKILQQLENNPTEMNGEYPTLLQSWQSKAEQMALIKVYKLQKKIHQYYDHLSVVVRKSPEDEKANAKFASMTGMKSALDEEQVLPSERIERFIKQLGIAKAELEDHRDPIWMRFLRDCLRILALTFSGVAIYRSITGQPVNFFKPAHGQRFVEDAMSITMSI